MSYVRSSWRAIAAVLVIAALLVPLSASSATAHRYKKPKPRYFQRIATIPVFLNTDVDLETVAEIVDATDDGKTLVYTDSETENLGFVDISSPKNPVADGVVALGGEPTSVAVRGRYALACINTSVDIINTSGDLKVVDINSRTIVRTIPLGGQPDSIAVSPNDRYAAICIENERDEDLGSGEPPQAPPGFVVIVDLVGAPANWSTRKVDLVGVPDLYPSDPEPEYVAINKWSVAIVTMQENNHTCQIRLRTGQVIRDWPNGTVDLDEIDTFENELIELDSSLGDVAREPDAVAWLPFGLSATANEGDLFGGSRGWSIYNYFGHVVWDSGNSVEHQTVRLGHYPEERSENKGNEPEGIAYARYGDDDLIFVGSERSSVILVYKLRWWGPQYLQTLPAGVGPEGLLPIPKRNLFVVASEVDDRGDKIRSALSIYKYGKRRPTYPTVESADRPDGLPIPWAALSALAADPDVSSLAYTVHDSFFRESRIYAMDVTRRPAIITDEIVLDDGGSTIDLDPEGLVVASDGTFWIASEGAGAAADADKTLNRLVNVDTDGTVLAIVTLPDATNANQIRFGFEGVAAVETDATECLYVAFQREWAGDPAGNARIGRYDLGTGNWTFFYYPLDAPTSPNGGWVGLSEIVAVDETTFAVIERDNQGGPDATIKRIYEFSVDGLTPQPEGGVFPVVTKSLVRDLMPDLRAPGGLVLEKVEGLTILRNGKVLIVTDNDGVDDASGETQLINLGRLFK